MTQHLGRYECLSTVGKGGMGEVLLAYDPTCDRRIAIKRIRSDLKGHEIIKNRFLREAKITSKLTHPGIIAIYSIHQEEDELYYTMPYIEGETLRQILRKAHYNPQDRQGSIPSLLQIFKSICQTVAYAHSKGILHRDLKPENILVGKYGEVVILDWGLAQMVTESPQELEIDLPADPTLTVPGKLVGTMAYMAPERALGASATVQTDLYALGVILYQILTLHLPFNRPSLKEYCKIYQHEKLLDPEEIAPYREVPPRLSRMVKLCLDPNPHFRYQNMEELMHALMSHLEGRSEWFESARLDLRIKTDWEFQENLLISQYIAITRSTVAADWVSLMVSKRTFAENTRLDIRIQIGERGGGIGLLLSVPEASERENPLEGYCLWVGSDLNPGAQLFRNTVEVMHQNDITLVRAKWHTLTIEKIDHNIHFYLNGQLQFTYLSYLPLFGTHVGLLARDDDFQIDSFIVSSGSQNLQVSCLSVPDAFLASKDYKRALTEYRRIGYSFPGHAEGREALFRAGITLLEEAKSSRSEENYTLALEEFAKLHTTPGAPLEYLGKALVYKSLRDYSEEIKCLELGLRRYKNHPLVDAIREQIIYRMHEASQTDRRSAYQLILIVLRLLPQVALSGDSQRLFKHLLSHWETLPFLEGVIDSTRNARFALTLAFWLAAPYILIELFHDLIKIKPIDPVTLGDLIFSLFELGSFGLAHRLMRQLEELKGSVTLEEGRDLKQILSLLEPLWVSHQNSLKEALSLFFSQRRDDIGVREMRTLVYLLQFALRTDQEELIHESIAKIRPLPLSREDQITLDALEIWAYLKEANPSAAGAFFEKYSLELLNQEGTLLHPLYGCYLYMTEGEEIANIHFAGVIDTPFPRSWALLGHELTNKISESIAWYSTSFLWERRQLYRQLILYYQCANNPDLEAYYRHLEQKEYIYIPE